jgi:transposase-like protein
MPKHKCNDLKLVAVRHYLQIHNQVETCKVFECSPRSLMRWVKRYKQGQ